MTDRRKRLLAGTLMLLGSALPLTAQTRSVSGQAGILGEWELAATVSHQDNTGQRWSGPLKLTHVGLCSVDGPEEKTGELQIRLSDPPGEADATLVIEGSVCSFRGRLNGLYDGVMTCPDRRDVPMMLSIH